VFPHLADLLIHFALHLCGLPLAFKTFTLKLLSFPGYALFLKSRSSAVGLSMQFPALSSTSQFRANTIPVVS
jgi:hypothetical protein